MALGPSVPSLRFLITVLSPEPHKLYDCIAIPLGDGWHFEVRSETDETPVEWYAPRSDSPLLRMLSEDAGGN